MTVAAPQRFNFTSEHFSSQRSLFPLRVALCRAFPGGLGGAAHQLAKAQPQPERGSKATSLGGAACRAHACSCGGKWARKNGCGASAYMLGSANGNVQTRCEVCMRKPGEIVTPAPREHEGWGAPITMQWERVFRKPALREHEARRAAITMRREQCQYAAGPIYHKEALATFAVLKLIPPQERGTRNENTKEKGILLCSFFKAAVRRNHDYGRYSRNNGSVST